MRDLIGAFIITFAIGHGVFLVVWWIIRGFPMRGVKRLPILLVNEEWGFGNWAMRSAVLLALEGEQTGEFISCGRNVKKRRLG